MMHPFFQYDTEEGKKSLLSRARKVALKALQQYDLDWNCIRFVQVSDTITFKIETDSNDKYLLRIHSDKLNKEEINSEILFLNELCNVHGLIVPVGVKGLNGSYVFECETEEGYQKPCISLMRWIEGQQLSGDITESQVYNIGVMMSKLHEASMKFKAPDHFVRPEWGSSSFRDNVRKLEFYYSRFLSNSDWLVYQSAITRIEHEVDRVPKNNQNYGLIHADLHCGNVIFHEETLYPIDFGRCGYGYYLYDMAGALLELSPVQRKIFIQGYESVKRLEVEYVSQLECFFIMFMIENYCHHSSNPNEISNLKAEQKYALAYIKEYLDGNSFLFKRITPIEMYEERNELT
ncbi:phosphotransferase enzyme family protein [Paenibacillus lentus]|uniref:phosphotransferase enzyme family protein n=1 Tax=Paenibacillus lentus TaxID=1338368 RepID=UPI00364A8E72